MSTSTICLDFYKVLSPFHFDFVLIWLNCNANLSWSRLWKTVSSSQGVLKHEMETEIVKEKVVLKREMEMVKDKVFF